MSDFFIRKYLKYNTLHHWDRLYMWGDLDWEEPAWTTRLGWRPDHAWELGISGSIGPYLMDDKAEASVAPTGKNSGDFDHLLIGADMAWTHGSWESYAEIMFSRFEVPFPANGWTGDADTLTWYAQTKYKWTARLFSAVRFGQEFHNEIRGQQWDNDGYRIDLSSGYKFDRHTQLKLQYSYYEHDAGFQQGPHTFAAQFTISL